MKIEIIKKALNSALYLINEEYETLEDDVLEEEYNVVISQLKEALEEIDK